MKKIKRNISTFLVFIFVFSLVQIQNVGTIVNAAPTLITSTQYDVDEGINAITKIPFITQWNTFMENVNIAAGYTATLYQSNGTTPVNSGKVSTGMKLKIYQNGSLQKTYTLIVLAEIYPDELVVNGVNTNLAVDDSDSAEKLPFGFSFNYYGNVYTDAYISTNGMLKFGDNKVTTGEYINAAIKTAAAPNNMICTFWDDLTPGSGRNPYKKTILYQTIGTAPNRKFIAQWTNMYFYNTTVQMGTFQAILHEGTNNIKIQYRELMGGSRSFGDSATIGIENIDGSKGVQYSFNDVKHPESSDPTSTSNGQYYKAIYSRQAIGFTFDGSTYTMNPSDEYDPIYLLDVNSPGMPTLTSPSNGALGIKRPVTFSWQGGSNTTNYQLLVATDSNFSNIVLNKSGITTTTYTDSTLNAGTTFYWKVLANNANGTTSSNPRSFITGTATSPTITTIQDQVIAKNTPTGALAFTISDPDTNISDILMSASSSDETVVKKENIQITGMGTSDTNRTVTITPENDATGTTTITLNVFDGSDIATSSFILKVGNPPSISSINDVFIDKDMNSGNINFTVDDVETLALNLTVSATSSNTSVVPNTNVILGGSGSNRTILVTPISSLTSGSSTITITVTDEDGLTASEAFVVTIGTPLSLALTQSPTTITNKDVTINADVNASSGIAIQKWLPGIKEVSDFASEGTTFTSTSFNVSDNGDYTVYVKDNSGREVVKTITINNIDKTVPVAPTLTADKTTPTKGDVTVTVTGEVGAKIEYRVDGGSWIEETTVTLSTNGTVEARVTDAAGNVSETSSLTINNIDKTAPTTPSITAAPTEATNGKVTITVTYPNDALVKQYKLGNGEWINYTAPVELSENTTIYVKGQDEAGNWSAEESLIISNIDKTAPAAPTLTADKTTPTKGEVTVTITGETEAKIEYRVDEGSWIEGTTVTLSTNGTVEARVTDAAGNVSETSSLTVDNIDKTAPLAPSITAAPTEATNGKVTVTVTYPDDAVVKQYKLGNGEWINYTAPVEVSENTTIYVKGQDEAGNWSAEESLIISNIDKTVPVAPTLTADKTTPTKGHVTVTITGEVRAKIEYRVDGGSWIEGTTVTLKANGKVEARVTDIAGNVSPIATLIISNIDKSAPMAPTNPVENDALNTFGWTNVTGYDNVSDYEYSLDNGATWIQATSNPQSIPDGNYAVGTIKVRVTANNGGTGIPAGAELSSTKEYTLTPGAPAAPTNLVQNDALNTFAWTNVYGYNNVSNYEYTLDNGITWIPAASNPQNIPDGDYPIGAVKVRVKADSTNGRPAGAALSSKLAYTLTPGAPAAPSEPLQDDESNTFGWTNVPEYTKTSDYEYSLDGGVTWTTVTSNPQSIPNGNFEAGKIKVRVKADSTNGRAAGEALSSTEAYTSAPNNPVIGGVLDGMAYKYDVTPTFTGGTATLNGQPFNNGTVVSNEGEYTLIVTGENNTTSAIVHFVIDKTAPVITGVTEGTEYKSSVTPTFNEGSATLNGKPYNGGTAISTEGSYALIVTDAAGNTSVVDFTIRKTTSTVKGVEDNMIYNVDVTPTFDEGTATLDGKPYTSGTVISVEGSYTLVFTDKLGNVSTIHFTIDKTAPVINGVTEGTTYKTSVTPTFNEGTGTLNGRPYTSGTVISSEGTYTLIVIDAAGNTSTVHFAIRKAAGSITGVADNMVYNKDVVPTFEEGTATLNGRPYTSGTVISTEDTYTLVYTDESGNVSTIRFAIDKTVPVITGVEEDGVYKTSVTPIFNEGTAILNGQPYNSGSAISNEGSYTLTVTDAAGNVSTVHFVISNTTPVINGVADDMAYNRDVIPTFEEGTVTLNGIPYISGTPISEEGLYVLQIKDAAGNTTGSAISFEIDKTAPIINGVANGESYDRDATPSFNEGAATLNGRPYTSGTPISSEGSYILTVTDAAGNTSSVYFTIRKPSSEVTGVSDDTVYNKDVIPIFEEGTATLNGKPYTSGTIISEEGIYELIVVSPPGNTTGSAISFEIDKTAPVISGVEDGGSYKSDIAPTFNEGTATLDGKPYTAGTPITSEGSHILIVTDAAGNTTVVRFVIRKEAASITGVTDGGVYRKAVTPIFTGGTATLDGQPYASGTSISTEGNHTLVVTDTNGNVTTIRFVIDKTPPVITGVTDNVVYKTDVTPTFEEGTATLDGVPYISGIPITSEGSHTLIVTDAAGNTSIAHFIISKTVPGVTGVTNGGMYNVDVAPTFNGGTATLDGEVYTSGTVISSEGNHTLVFTDAAGNITTVAFVIDKTAPVINLNGSNEVITIVHDDYIDAGVTATDNYEGDITSRVVTINPVNKDAAGDYTITYNAVDRSGNIAKEVTRKVRIVQNPTKMELTGIVTNQDTAVAIENAKVSLYDFGHTLIAETTTDNSGRYSIKNITLGNYKLIVENEKYSTKTIDVNISSQGNGDATIIKDVQLVNFTVKLSSNPSSIVGDGVSSTTIEAVVLDKDNEPISGIEVSFSATMGSFPSGNKAITDSNGKATVIYQSEQITGVQSKNVIVKAVVNDTIRDLHSEAEILVTFEPSSIKGIVVDNATNLPIEGAIVEISKDFDGDGIVDFYAKMITDATGKYKIAVPRGNLNYNLKITKPITIGDTIVLKTFEQSASVGTVIGKGDETFNASNVAAGLILFKQSDGSVKELTNYANYSINVIDKQTNSSKVISLEDASSSIFQVNELENGKNYELQLTYDFGNGKKIVVGTTNISIDNDGQIGISTILIDPYGTITDSVTGSIISGAYVVLYYANTPRNISNGVTPNAVVQLPEIIGFAPNDNKNPQISDVNGEYAFMVFPTTDYYIVVTKSGYNNYVSPTISVEQDIVQHNIKMVRKSSSSDSSNNSSVSLTTETFDKNAEKQSDINVTMTLNGNSLISITDGKTTLVNGTDYKVNGSIVTISKSYLAQQSGKSVVFTFNFSAGDSQTFSIALIDTSKDTETDATNIVMPNKIFELKFNKKLDSKTVNLNNVYVSYDKAGLNKVSGIKVQLSEDSKIIKVLPTAEGYKSTETYYLIVTANVTDMEGNKVNSVLYKFTASDIKVWSEEKEISAEDRTFKVIFNKPIDSLSVNYNNIFITSDEKGLNKITDIRLRVNPNNSNVIDLIVPKGTLIKGHNYYVFVNSDILSTDKKKEGNVWLMQYIVKE